MITAFVHEQMIWIAVIFAICGTTAYQILTALMLDTRKDVHKNNAWIPQFLTSIMWFLVASMCFM